jgi:HEAT repeat protein
MTQELLLAGHGAVLQITSAAQLYDTFIDLLEERESGKRPPEGALERRMTAGFSLKIVGYIGWRMLEDGAASIRLNKVGDLLSEFLTEERWASWWGDSPKPSVGELLRFLSRRAPLKEMSAASLAPSQLGFMHLTYRDAFAGRHLDLVRNEEDGYSALAERVLDPAQTYWPAVVFLAGREVNAGVTPRQVVDLAFESKRQELLLLAARCVGGRWDTPGGDVGDLLISILDAFKNWDKAFDYDLMRLSRRLVSRLNPDFPQRLRDDLNYFIDKYASVVPREIMNATPEALLALLEGAEEEVTVNALYSLARRRYTSTTLRDTIASKVGDRVNDWRGTVLDQAVAALTDIGSQTSLPLLRSIVTSDSYPVRSRAFAANGVAQLGSLEDLPTLVGLLRDHEFKYRDSASWSLQMLAKRLAVKEPDSLTRISHDYMEALQTETDDTSGKYAKGNILYSLGVLNAHWFGTQIQQFVMHEIEPYVIEDGLLCLGLLAWESSKPLLESFIGHPDPAVRLKACEALLRCGQTDWSCIAELLEDKYRIVRRLVESILHSSPTDQFDDRAGAEMLAMVLKRGAIRTDALKQTFRISSAERPLLELITSQHPVSDLLVYMPTLVGSGENQELRLAVEDVTRLRSYFRLDG